MNSIVKNIGLGAGGLAVAVAIYLAGGATANTYPGAILTHLVDIVQGTTTKTEVALNAPGWGFGQPIAAPVLTSVASTTGGTLASTTPTGWYFEVAALDSNGTTTPSSAVLGTVSGDLQGLNVGWTAVPGATGYAIFFSTTTPNSFTQYFYATTSTQYTFATSSKSIAGTDTLDTGTAFGIHLNQNGRSWINNLSTATSSATASTTAFQVGGGAAFVAQATTTACESDTAGVIFFNLSNSHQWGCSGTAWIKIF